MASWLAMRMMEVVKTWGPDQSNSIHQRLLQKDLISFNIEIFKNKSVQGEESGLYATFSYNRQTGDMWCDIAISEVFYMQDGNLRIFNLPQTVMEDFVNSNDPVSNLIKLPILEKLTERSRIITPNGLEISFQPMPMDILEVTKEDLL